MTPTSKHYEAAATRAGFIVDPAAGGLYSPATRQTYGLLTVIVNGHRVLNGPATLARAVQLRDAALVRA